MKQKEVKKDEKSNRKRNILFAVLIAFLMITSVFGIFVYNTNDSNNEDTSNLEYGGYTFYSVEGKWAIVYNNQYIYFDFNPKQLEDIALDENLIIPVSGEKIYIAQDYSKDRSNQDFSVRHLAGVLSLVGAKPVLSCIDETDCPDIPLVECGGSKNVIDFRVVNNTGSKTRIYKEGSCSVFEGDSQGLLKAINKYEYFVLGIVSK